MQQQPTTPSPSLLSKYRFPLDAAWSLTWGSAFFNNSADKLPAVFLMADSSPQGHDWFIVEISFFKPLAESSAGPGRDFFELVKRLIDTKADNTEYAKRQRADWTSILQKSRTRHCFPPMALGGARSSAGFKAQCLLQALFLEFQEWGKVARFLEAVQSVTTDMGTEASLPSICLAKAGDICDGAFGVWKAPPRILNTPL